MVDNNSIVSPVLEGEVAKRDLHFFWLVDCSGSMNGKKMNSLNRAISEALPAIKTAMESHPNIRIKMSAIKFSSSADWQIGPDPVELEKVIWTDLNAGGNTATAKALKLLIQGLDIEKMPRRSVPPVCILISDGFCTDPESEYDNAISELNKIPWGIKGIRLSIAVGDESEYDANQLLKFVNQEAVGLLKADTPTKLIEYIKWASTTATIQASIGQSTSSQRQSIQGQAGSNVILPSPPKLDNAGDVF